MKNQACTVKPSSPLRTDHADKGKVVRLVEIVVQEVYAITKGYQNVFYKYETHQAAGKRRGLCLLTHRSGWRHWSLKYEFYRRSLSTKSAEVCCLFAASDQSRKEHLK